MTNTDETLNPPPDGLGVVAAFLDGAAVEGEALKKALATAEGRDYLVDLLALRQAVVGIGPARNVSKPPKPAGARRWIAGAAAALLISLGAYAIAERVGFVAEVAGTASSVEAVVSFDGAPVAPQPTHVIQLEPLAGRTPEGD